MVKDTELKGKIVTEVEKAAKAKETGSKSMEEAFNSKGKELEGAFNKGVTEEDEAAKAKEGLSLPAPQDLKIVPPFGPDGDVDDVASRLLSHYEEATDKKLKENEIFSRDKASPKEEVKENEVLSCDTAVPKAEVKETEIISHDKAAPTEVVEGNEIKVAGFATDKESIKTKATQAACSATEDVVDNEAKEVIPQAAGSVMMREKILITPPDQMLALEFYPSDRITYVEICSYFNRYDDFDDFFFGDVVVEGAQPRTAVVVFKSSARVTAILNGERIINIVGRKIIRVKPFTSLADL